MHGVQWSSLLKGDMSFFLCFVLTKRNISYMALSLLVCGCLVCRQYVRQHAPAAYKCLIFMCEQKTISAYPWCGISGTGRYLFLYRHEKIKMIAFSVNRFIFVIVIFNSDRQFKLFPTFRPGLVLLATVPTQHFSFSWKARTISMAVQCTNYIATVTIFNSTELLGSIDIHHSVNLKTHLSSLC